MRQIYIFFIDIRATDRLEDFYAKVKRDPNIHFFKGKVAKITADGTGKNLVLRVEDTTTAGPAGGGRGPGGAGHGHAAQYSETNDSRSRFPMMITASWPLSAPSPASTLPGTTRTPGRRCQESVQDGTAAALKAIQSVARR